MSLSEIVSRLIYGKLVAVIRAKRADQALPLCRALVAGGITNLEITLTTPDALQAICNEIHRRSKRTRILLLGIFPRGAKPDATRAKVAEVNERIARFDGQSGVTYLDIGAKFLESDGSISREIMNEFLHPTAKGYATWADAMEPTLKRLLGKSN